MSMNILITASRAISFSKPDGTTGSDLQEIKFDAYQTPTKVTHDILAADDKAGAYVAWVESVSETVQDPVYAEDDIFCEREPVSYEEYNSGAAHIAEFREWADSATANGFTVAFEMI